MKVAVVGATGMVGEIMLKVLQERKFPITELLPVASERSVGTTIQFNGTEHTLLSMEQAFAMKPAIAIFSAVGEASLAWATRVAAMGCTVLDNCSTWPLHSTKSMN